MRNNSTPSTPVQRAPMPLQAALWIVAIGGPALVLHNNGVQAARREAEERVLSQVALTIQSPSAKSGEVFGLLARHEREVSGARYYRTCSRLGMKTDWKPDWNGLFTNLTRQGKEEQGRARDRRGVRPRSKSPSQGGAKLSYA